MAEISCSGVLEMPSKKFRHFGTIRSNTGRASKCNQECCKWVHVKRSKKTLARPRGEPSAWLKFPVQACWRCPSKKFRHFGTISSGPNCSFAGTVKHRSSNTIRGIAGTRNVANRSVLKDKKNSQGRAHTCMRDQSSLCSSKFPVQAWWRNSAFWHDLFRSKPESGVQTQQMQPEAMQGPGLLQMGPC